MMTPSIAVVVPVYNRATTCLPTLDSIAYQSLPPQRLVVIDDGSSDGSADSVESWSRKRRPPFDVQVIRKPNGGVSSARNRGIAASGDCRWFAFLDSDDCWPADFLARAAAAIDGKPDVVAASADRLFVDEPGGKQRRYDLAALSPSPALWMLRYGAAISSCSVVRADLVRELGGFPEGLKTGEDAWLYLPLSLRGAWLHLPGDAVRFIRRAPAAGGEEASLSKKFSDNHRRWARIYEAFFTGLNYAQLKQLPSRKRFRQYLADRWARAGVELESHGRALEAAACYARAIRWRPGKWDRWKDLLRMPVHAVRGGPSAATRKAA